MRQDKREIRSKEQSQGIQYGCVVIYSMSRVFRVRKGCLLCLCAVPGSGKQDSRVRLHTCSLHEHTSTQTHELGLMFHVLDGALSVYGKNVSLFVVLFWKNPVCKRVADVRSASALGGNVLFCLCWSPPKQRM